MNVLILYSRTQVQWRQTIEDYLDSFKRYLPGHRFHYLNVTHNHRIPSFLFYARYDAILFHYSFLAGERFIKDDTYWSKKILGVEKLKGYKIAIPQDEMDLTDRLCELFKKTGVNLVGTCFENEEDIKKAYPLEKTGVKDFVKVFTGYVDRKLADDLSTKLKPFHERPIDIGYRARRLPPNYGKHGQLKYELLEAFEDELKNTSLVCDLRNTNNHFFGRDKEEKLGNEWHDFLLASKAFLGCEGGSSLLDRDGSIKERVNKYLEKRPDAPFQEVEKACFSGMDYNISLFAVSPRHFEAAMTKTLQLLVEGNYGGALRPWKHYIPIKKDLSNVKEVIKALEDKERCEEIVEQCYKDVVLSEEYSYGTFTKSLLSHVPNIKRSGFNTFFLLLVTPLIQLRNIYILWLIRLKSWLKKLIKGLVS